jgi:hypothetical protein
MEAGGQHMEQEATHELAGFECHRFITGTALPPVVFPAEAHAPPIEGEQALVSRLPVLRVPNDG